MLNVIRSYMVSLGYRVDVPSFNSVMYSINNMERTVGALARNVPAQFGIATAALAAFGAATTVAMTKFSTDVAWADLNNQIFARRMWMNVDTAVAYRQAIQALGVSIQDLYLSPELMEKFLSLRGQSLEMGFPTGFEEQMQSVRSMSFEFQRLKLEAQQSMYWISFYFSKALAGPGADFTAWLRGLNDWLTKNIAVWTKNVGDLFASIVFHVINIGRAFLDVGATITDVWLGLGSVSQKAIAFIAGAGALFWVMSGPIGMILTLVAAAMLLLEDWYVYEHGGDSALPDLWGWMDKTTAALQDSGVFKTFTKDLDSLFLSVGDLGKAFGELFKTINGGNAHTDIFAVILDQINWMIEDLTTVMKLTTDIIKGDMGQAERDWTSYQENNQWHQTPLETRKLFNDTYGIGAGEQRWIQENNLTDTSKNIDPMASHNQNILNPQNIAPKEGTVPKEKGTSVSQFLWGADPTRDKFGVPLSPSDQAKQKQGKGGGGIFGDIGQLFGDRAGDLGKYIGDLRNETDYWRNNPSTPSGVTQTPSGPVLAPTPGPGYDLRWFQVEWQDLMVQLAKDWKIYGPGGLGPVSGTANPQSYVRPGALASAPILVNLQPTYHLYGGGDPTIVSANIQKINMDLLIRNLRPMTS